MPIYFFLLWYFSRRLRQLNARLSNVRLLELFPFNRVSIVPRVGGVFQANRAKHCPRGYLTELGQFSPMS